MGFGDPLDEACNASLSAFSPGMEGTTNYTVLTAGPSLVSRKKSGSYMEGRSRKNVAPQDLV